MKNPFIIIPIITIAIALFSVGKQVADSPLLNSNSALTDLYSDNRKKIEEMQSELATLKNVKNPSEHQIWHMAHLEKSIAHIQKHTPAPTTVDPVLTGQFKNLSMIATMMLFGVVGAAYHYAKKAKRQPIRGFNHKPNRTSPFNDPVAQNTHWQSASTYASNFPTQKLLQTPKGYKVVMSIELLLICQCLIFMGLVPILIDHLIAGTRLLDGLSSGYGALILIGVALWGGLALNTIEINTNERTIKKGKQRYSFNQVHALQVITSLAGGRGHGIYKNYELNLVFKDSERLNLLNHGGEAEFEQQTERLSKLLAVPVWEA
ncbi:hypothetical protein HF888_04515 [Bermanella marisrubri]|uniref:Uncharacterized protein n=1 Tax=Bermanella marisrubri TaxID=207949 RepID=Q1N1J1_9GAMM|nr:hypothetical protein [Bermanella marisrubri]EAT12059.1 hypothetical protein RED65_03435 [Oceanobacter sp. RED65] [Bermanella marisrubri]QIZ83529.1 hypothetical protein HF888_04515 [Bermanella marisrubri]